MPSPTALGGAQASLSLTSRNHRKRTLVLPVPEMLAVDDPVPVALERRPGVRVRLDPARPVGPLSLVRGAQMLQVVQVLDMRLVGHWPKPDAARPLEQETGGWTFELAVQVSGRTTEATVRPAHRPRWGRRIDRHPSSKAYDSSSSPPVRPTPGLILEQPVTGFHVTSVCSMRDATTAALWSWLPRLPTADVHRPPAAQSATPSAVGSRIRATRVRVDDAPLTVPANAQGLREARCQELVGELRLMGEDDHLGSALGHFQQRVACRTAPSTIEAHDGVVEHQQARAAAHPRRRRHAS